MKALTWYILISDKKISNLRADEPVETNKSCIFPFKVAGKTNNKCADIGRHENICATEVNGDKKLTSFGTCIDECNE